MKEFLELDDFKRSAELYLRALWGKGFLLKRYDVENEYEIASSYIKNESIFLPSKITLKNNPTHYYRAAAAHASLHVIYGGEAYDVSDFNLMQRSMIGLIEDLRVELRAIQMFPGLRKLWLDYHFVENIHDTAHSLMLRLSRSILDPNYQDQHHWVLKGKAMMLLESVTLMTPDHSIQIGLSLANDLGQMRLPLNSGKYEQLVLYRDDNRFLWSEKIEYKQEVGSVEHNSEISLSSSKLVEYAQGINVNISDDEGGDKEGFYIRRKVDESLQYRKIQNEFIASKSMYPEWDYRTNVLKQDWCTLFESRPKAGSIEKIKDVFDKNKIVMNRMRVIAKKLQAEKLQRIRKTEYGDEIDLDPMIDAMLAMRSNKTPDTRVFMHNDYRRHKNLAISILLDLSESTNHTVNDSTSCISQLMRDAVLLLGETLSIAGEKFAISGFSSNGRHQVCIINYKDFSERFDETSVFLSDIIGQHSTRMGSAIRHCGDNLSKQQATRKLLLVVTDGAPSDIDVFDERYLEYDSRDAVQTLARNGITPFCLNLDAAADQAVEHIFGKNRYETLDSLLRLPEMLSRLYLKHARY